VQAQLGWARKWPCLVMVSGSEEYVPPDVDVASLGQRLAAAIGSSAKLVVVDGAPHSLEGHEEEAVAAIIDFLAGLRK
jgi:pimeloyl-ACP methyl ester carboxylesterase